MSIINDATQDCSILGIDAAWTNTEPSGVALVKKVNSIWKLFAVSASYEGFYKGDGGLFSIDKKQQGSNPDINRLIKSSVALAGINPSIIAVDMPLSHKPIKERRMADNSISSEYGGRWASTHSPTDKRPGPVSDQFTANCFKNGYPLLTSLGHMQGLIEVYPHTALIELFNSEKRLPYKISKISKYWPNADRAERRHKILQNWLNIIDALNEKISGVKERLQLPELNSATWKFKAFEDGLDAVICCLVGIYFFENRAISYGDDDSAIWVPKFDINR
jgi:predicted RNase H-like nuclease